MPRYLTAERFLSGARVGEAHASAEAATTFINDADESRRASLCSLTHGLADRVKLRANAPRRPDDRLLNPLSALQSAPGGGKSTFLDLLAALSAWGQWDTRFCDDTDMCAILNDSIPIPITYNNSFNACSAHDKDVETGLAMRILHSFFVQSTALDFESFFELLPEGTVVRAASAVRCSLLAAERAPGAKVGVLLLVDEIVKLLDFDANAPLLSILGVLLDTFPSRHLNIVCTTLDAFMLHEESTKSGRPLRWVTLPPLSQHASETLMLRALQRQFPAAGITHLPTAVRIAICNAAGHPRSLQYAMEAMLDLCTASSAGVGVGALHSERSLKSLRDSAISRFTAALAPTLAAVRAALRGAALPLDGCPPGCDAQLRELIAKGTFINTDVTGATFAHVVPKLSMLCLLHFAATPFDSGSVEFTAAKCIKAMAAVEEGGAAHREKRSPSSSALSPRPTLAGSYFERFIAHWIKLKAILRQGELPTVLSLFHAEALKQFVPSGSPLLVPFQLDGIASPTTRLQQSDHHFSVAAANGELDDCVNSIVSFKDSNPFFDLLVTASCANAPTSCLALGIETR